MSRVEIFAFVKPDFGSGLRAARWKGDIDWPSAPPVGGTWFHCGDWGGEVFDRVSFCGPPDISLHCEVRTDVEVLQHLVAEHGFEGTYAD